MNPPEILTNSPWCPVTSPPDSYPVAIYVFLGWQKIAVSFVPSHDTPRARQSNPQSSLTAKTHKWQLGTSLPRHQEIHLTIKVGSEWIAHEDDGPMGYWLRGYEGERNNCFSQIRLVGKKYRDKTTLASKTRLRRHCLGFQSRRFSLVVGHTI